jgi:hypothetical protein
MFADAVAAAAEGDAGPAAEAGPDTEEEEDLTHIFFNLEEGIGVPELISEADVNLSPPDPLPRGVADPQQLLDVEGEVVAQNEAPQFPGGQPRRATPSAIRSKPKSLRANASSSEDAAGWLRAQTTRSARTVTMQLKRTRRSDQFSSVLLGVGVLMLVVALAGLIYKTPVGVTLGLRKPSVASIEVRTSPAVGAAVKLDGIYRGRAPLRLEGVRSGRRVIAVNAEGYLEAAREIELAGGKRAQLLIELEPLPAARR